MKYLVRLLKIIGVSVLTAFVILLLTRNNHINCSALNTFSGESSIGLFFDFLKTVLIGFGIWIVGIVIYFLIKKKKQINLYIFFSLLTIFSLHSFIITALMRAPEKSRELKQGICNKSTDDGMMLNFNQLKKDEYDFINLKTNRLPTIPKEADSINISYFRDDLLGDYHLIIEMILPSEQELDTLEYPKWTLNKGRYRFEEYED